MAPSIKLYYFPMSCAYGVQLLLEDSGLSYEPVTANIKEPVGRAEYLKNVNPKGQVPAISIDGDVVTETPGIVTAISQLVPEKNYTGSNPKEVVRAYEWLSYLGTTVHSKRFGAMFNPAAFTDEPAAQDGVKAKAKSALLDQFKYIEGKLAARGDSKFVLGDNFTGVDAYLTVFVLWSKFFGIWDESAYPSWNKWFTTVSELDAFKAVHKAHTS